MADDFREFIEQVKGANAIEDVIEASGAEYKLQRKRGNYLRGESHDSLVVRVDEQYYVWNEKGEKGDVFNWLEARNKWDFWTSLKWLAERKKIDLPLKMQKNDSPKARASYRIKGNVFGIAQRMMAKWLWEDKDALGYVRGRGWTDETIKRAGLGFSGRLIADQLAELKGEISMYEIDPASPAAAAILGYRGDVRAWGKRWNIDVQQNWIEWGVIPGLVGRTRLVYPHWVGGRVQYMSARNILGAEINKENRTIKSYNLASAMVGHRQVYYNHEYGRRADEVVCVEGQADAITLGQWGIPAMAIVGINWDDHLEILAELRKRHKTIYIGLDSDQAGLNALIGKDRSWHLGRVLGSMARVVRWGGEKDANDWLQAMAAEGKSDQDQRDAVKNALESAATITEEAAAWGGELRGAERDEAIKTIFSLIGRMSKVNRAQYRSGLAKALHIGVRDFDNILKETLGGGKEESEITTLATLGGYIGGWLLDYVYDAEKDAAKLVYRDPDRHVGVRDTVDIDGVRYAAKRPSVFIQGGGVLFASDLGELKSTRELVAIVESFLNKYYLMGDKYLGRILAYYVMLTWVYDSFNTICYLRAIGEAGAGKSELMNRLGAVCYRLLSSSGATSAAAFFRVTETYRGTVFLDEADLHDGGDMTNDLVKFLNLGAMKGGSVIKLADVPTENGREWEAVLFNAFCPKLIAMRREFRDDAVGSRSLTFKLTPREPIELKEAGVRLFVDDEFRQRAQKIRNLLLRWRMEHWEPEIEVGEELMDLEISSRLNQVTMPLKAIARDDQELQREIETFLRAYNEEMVLERSMSIPARLVEAMWRIKLFKSLHEKYVVRNVDGEMAYVGDISVTANEIIDRMNREQEDDTDDGGTTKRKRKKDQLSPHRVGKVIRGELQMRVLARMKGGYPVLLEETRMLGLAKRYGIDVDQIKREAEDDAKELAKSAAKQPFI
jgi:hypothetical protein